MRHGMRELTELTEHPRFIVWRAARGVPLGFMDGNREGRWDHWRPVDPPPDPCLISGPHAHAVPSGRREHREDDAVAQVIEVHPCPGNYASDPPHDPAPLPWQP